MKSITESSPKPLLEVCGRSLLDRLIDGVSKTQPEELVVITGYLGDQIEQHVREYAAHAHEGLSVRFFRETTPLGNAGALKYLSGDDMTTLFLFADLLTDIDFERLFSRHRDSDTDVLLASHYETYQLSLGELVERDGQVEEYLEKPVKRYLICSGIALFAGGTLASLKDLETPFGLVDVVNKLINTGYRVSHWNHKARWIDVNTPELVGLAKSQRWD